jgi:hypothetical protein
MVQEWNRLLQVENPKTKQLMLIPIFGSSPTHLNKNQDESKRLILGELGHAGLEWRSLGQTDYPTAFPLLEVLQLARFCCGGVILGFSQFTTAHGVWKKGTPYEKAQNSTMAFATPWNQLEAGVLFALDLPLLVFRERYISGGIFDNGVSELFIHEIPSGKISRDHRKGLTEVIRKFGAKAHARYYQS